MNRVSRSQRAVSGALVWVVLGAAIVFFVLPVLWLLLAPTKTENQLVAGSALSFGSFDDLALAWNNLIEFQNAAILLWLKNSAIYSVAGLLITVAASIPAGYALAMTRFAGRKLLLTITLIVMLVPGTALVLPIYLELSAIGLVNSIWSVILPSAFFPFGVYLTYIYFSTSVPPNLLDAARIDGCDEWQIFARIALPLAKPIIALVVFFSFIANWNNYFLPVVMLNRSADYPVQVGLQQLVASTPAFAPMAGGDALNIGRPELALAVLISVVPVLIIFLVSQRSLVSGLTAGATKE
ncbi:carbohydrate ABC transporter permease [Microbacterium sp. NPDC090218]